MSLNKRLGRLLAVSTVILFLLFLATALAMRAAPEAADAQATADYPVVLNIRTLIYHCPSCELTRRCGTDCETMSVAEARRRGAKPCVSCGGNCLAR